MRKTSKFGVCGSLGFTPYEIHTPDLNDLSYRSVGPEKNTFYSQGIPSPLFGGDMEVWNFRNLHFWPTLGNVTPEPDVAWIVCRHVSTASRTTGSTRRVFRGLGSTWGRNLAISITLAIDFYNSLYYVHVYKLWFAPLTADSWQCWWVEAPSGRYTSRGAGRGMHQGSGAYTDVLRILVHYIANIAPTCSSYRVTRYLRCNHSSITLPALCQPTITLRRLRQRHFTWR